MPTTANRGWTYPSSGQNPYFTTIEGLFTAQDTDVATALARPWTDAKVYGAVGNGSTNDASALTSAISAANTAGGGVVYVPAGTYLIGAALTLTANVSLRGAGRGVTTFKRGFTSGSMLTCNGNQLVADITFDGDAAGAWATSNDEVDAANDRVIYERCEFKNSKGLLQLGLYGGADSIWIRNCKFIGQNHATVGVSFGIWADGGVYEDLQVSGCEFRDFKLNGIFARGATVVQSYFENNHIQTSGGGGHVCLLGTVPSVLIGNVLTGGASVTSGFELNGDTIAIGNRFISIPGAGIVLQAASGYTVTGNILISCGSHGVLVGANVTDFAITSNQIKSSGGWGVRIDPGSSDRYIVRDNIYQSNTSGNLSDGGSGSNKVAVVWT